ncbi:MAG: pirin family protein [Moorea sp. SIO4G2]|uniref:pirin family protein n=1 Tax=unclassified Moorena TaxID=2683338 RepID=UPI0013F895DE|nr:MULTISPECIES: pirin family protein [unclassified Moorena]NEO17695.1 pirin family protein [Moorena sp. SIO3E8]NEO60936.1 pirin family protein [Moorena sp. SIO4G2]NEQ04248.1 pirin family protein [Moorena sp. SIO3F7]
MTVTTNNQKIIKIRKSSERGHAHYGWLDSYHTFSFANYYDPAHMGFGKLRVINQDRIEGGTGFGIHSHRDMEIISYVLEGALEHKDTLGNTTVIRPGEVQRMSAGKGIAHSEYNYSGTDIAHFLQIWILPNQTGLTPSYEQKFFAPDEKQNQLKLVASQDGRDGSVSIHQDVNVYGTNLDAGASVMYQANQDRHIWVQVARGQVKLDNYLLQAGDGAAISQAESVMLVGQEQAEVLLFDLA